jgi:TonB family protein
MRYGLRFRTWQCLLLWLCLCLGPGPIRAARKPDFGPLNEQLANDIVKAKLRSVIIVDFQDRQGKPSILGWYVADELSENWLAEKQKFRVLDRSELKDTRVEREDLGPEMLKRLGSVWGVDAIITGTVETTPEHYVVATRIRRVADDATIADESFSVPHSRILDLLKPLPDPNSISRAGINGVDVPTCTACPVPGYTDRARAAKIQGNIVLSIVVSEDGRTEAVVAIVKGLAFGLTEKAIKDVSEWRFKPATKEGKPVPVIVPIEVTMRIN